MPTPQPRKANAATNRKVIQKCLKGFRSNKGEAGSAGLDSGGALPGTKVSTHTTPSGTRYQLVRSSSAPTYSSCLSEGSAPRTPEQRPSSIVVYVFGGGFVAGSPRQYLPLTSQLAKSGCWVAVPYYSLSTPYPTPMNQVLAVAKHLRSVYGKEGNSDKLRIMVGGDSAGGTIACGAALKAPELFDGLFLYSPWLDLGSDLATYRSRAFAAAQNTGDPIFTTPAAVNMASSQKLALNYLGRKSQLRNPIANPIRAGPALLRKLPPVLIFVGDRETILGGSERFIAKLQEVGRVKDALQVYSGMWHVFPMYSQGCGAGARLAQADAAISQTKKFIVGACGGGVDMPAELSPQRLTSVDARLVLLPLANVGLGRGSGATRRRGRHQVGRKRGSLTRRKRG